MKKTKRKTKDLYDDHDDAHFSDNPAVPSKTRKRWRTEEKRRVGSSGKGHPAVKVTKKKSSRKRVAGK